MLIVAILVRHLDIAGLVRLGFSYPHLTRYKIDRVRSRQQVQSQEDEQGNRNPFIHIHRLVIFVIYPVRLLKTHRELTQKQMLCQ